MITFLQAIANAYASTDAALPDISRALFLFPNKRSATFFIKYLSEALPAGSILPATATISDFSASLSGRVVDSKIDLLFLLFEAYRDIVNRASDGDAGKMPAREADGSVSFDRFRLWGETVLNDFNEVDMQLVDVDHIFKNVKDFRSISSNFLTPEQREVMELYFGYNSPDYDSDSFWKSFGDFDSEGNLLMDSKGTKSRFIALWQVLAPLYHALNSRLEKLGLTTPGGSFRLAAERLRKQGIKLLRDYDRVVFVGFNALTRSERDIFSTLRKIKDSESGHPFAEFFWDASGMLFDGDENPAGRFVSYNRKVYPSPEWADPFMKDAVVDSIPQMDVCAVPSNSAQLKVIGEGLKALYDKIGEKPFRDARVAIVLPDEGLLQPLLYSLPSEMGNPNLTMGYPLRQTSVSSFVALLRRLLLRRKGSGDSTLFFLQDLRPFLAHPFAQSIFGSRRISCFLAGTARMHKVMVPLPELQNLAPSANDFFRPLSQTASPVEIVDYIDEAVAIVDKSFAEHGANPLKAWLERAHIAKYRDALRRIRLSFVKYKVGMTPSTAFLLIDRLVAAESVAFEGEPLAGLQIMGMLETRCLDFDYLFMPSLNEKILPRRARLRTFIPDSLRRAYGMPPAHYQEDIFAYYFFRLLSRARSANLLYDSRVGATDGITRYILQMDHLLQSGSIRFTDYSFNIAAKLPDSLDVKKDGKIQDILNNYLDPESDRRLSASALSTYANCQARFFYEKVMSINTDPEPTDAIDAATTGSIVHSAMMQLYLPDPDYRGKLLSTPIVVQPDDIKTILKSPGKIEDCVRRLVNELHFHLPPDDLDRSLSGSPAHEAAMLCKLIENILKRDLRMAPFRLYGCEVEGRIAVPLTDGRNVNFAFAIDRIDRPGDSGDAPLRIVDYKTGTVRLEADDMADVIACSYNGKNIFQLFLYADLFQQFVTATKPAFLPVIANGIAMEIYDVPNILKPDVKVPIIAKTVRDIYLEPEDEFRKELDDMLVGIFDFSKPFKQTDKAENCRLCPLTALCRR